MLCHSSVNCFAHHTLNDKWWLCTKWFHLPCKRCKYKSKRSSGSWVLFSAFLATKDLSQMSVGHLFQHKYTTVNAWFEIHYRHLRLENIHRFFLSFCASLLKALPTFSIFLLFFSISVEVSILRKRFFFPSSQVGQCCRLQDVGRYLGVFLFNWLLLGTFSGNGETMLMLQVTATAVSWERCGRSWLKLPTWFLQNAQRLGKYLLNYLKECMDILNICHQSLVSKWPWVTMTIRGTPERYC